MAETYVDLDMKGKDILNVGNLDVDYYSTSTIIANNAQIGTASINVLTAGTANITGNMNVDGNITCGTNILCDILTASTGVSANDITGGDITCSVGYIDTLISKDVTVTRSDELELIKLTTSTDSSRDMLIWGRPTGSTNSEIAVGALSVGNDDEGSIIRANTWDNSTGGDFVQLRDNITELRCASAVIMAVGEPTSSDCAATKNYVDAI